MQDKAGWFYYEDGEFEFNQHKPFSGGWFSDARAVEIIKPYGYKLSHLTQSNAFFVCKNTFVDKEDLDASTAYDQGYRNIKDRKVLYHYNEDMDCLLDMTDEEGLVFINKFFAKYEGKYEARII